MRSDSRNTSIKGGVIISKNPRCGSSRLDAFEIFMVVGKDQTRTACEKDNHDTNTIDLPRKSQQGKSGRELTNMFT